MLISPTVVHIQFAVVSLDATRGLEGMTLTLEVEPSDATKKYKVTHEEEGVEIPVDVSAGMQPSKKCAHPP